MADRGRAGQQLGVGAVLPAGSLNRRAAGVRTSLPGTHRRSDLRLCTSPLLPVAGRCVPAEQEEDEGSTSPLMVGNISVSA